MTAKGDLVNLGQRNKFPADRESLQTTLGTNYISNQDTTCCRYAAQLMPPCEFEAAFEQRASISLTQGHHLSADLSVFRL